MTPAIACTLTPKQREVNRRLGGPQRHFLAVGGSRSGKTFLLCRALLTRALREPRSRHAILRHRMNAVRQSIWLDTLPKVLRLCFPDAGRKCEWRNRDGFLVLPNLSEVWIAGLDDKERVEKILGQEYATLYYNECSQIPYNSVLMALTRLAQKCELIRNRAYYDLNPTGTGHWTYRQFIEHRDPESLQRLAKPEDFEFAYLNPGDNDANVDAEYIESLRALPERQRRRFFEGKYVAQLDGALWTIELIERSRVSEADLPPMRRIVVAVDPSGASSTIDVRSDAIGIVVAGLGMDDNGYLLQDATGLYSPEQWGRIVCDLYSKWKAERVVGERNFGGDMVRAVIHGANRNVSYKEVTASRGKVLRAEPIAAIYERDRIRHVGRFPQLEDELINFTTAGYLGGSSPNRADAAVWAFTELFPDGPSYGLFQLWQRQAESIADAEAPPAAPLIVTAGELADAQKREADDFPVTKPKTLGKVATSAATPTCPKCGNKFLQLFSESWRCICGATGQGKP